LRSSLSSIGWYAGTVTGRACQTPVHEPGGTQG
jgi:hypothetical protein